ncbi:ATP-binding protein [Spirillospora sp. CA-294931]|uniref:ATP-binding protein n=1 Tax=Spirillospora sp. CA-294931 TaxID=3240042 RepID=UPI003D932429
MNLTFEGRLEGRAGRLPAEPTTFVGRAEELALIRSTLRSARLVTLVGPGGVGKTRLAVRAACAARGAHDGVRFVDVSRVADVELLPHAVAAALHLPDQPEDDPLDALTGYLASRRTLLVLDNCEHLVDACAIMTGVLLRAAPDLRVLATSREALNMIGEHVVPVAPFAAPRDPERGGWDAIHLFADRAAAAVPGFRVDAANRRAVADLCHRLEGMPLAIELAAVRLRAMSLDRLLTGLDDRFRLLGPARTGNGRHVTLAAAVEWSHDLCAPAERRLWERLSVFAGDFDLKAAEYVGGGDGADVLETLSRLIDKSIVLKEPGGERYRMLDTLARFGLDRLRESGREAETRRRHRDWFLRLTDRFGELVVSEAQYLWLHRMRADHANLCRAMEFGLTTPGEQESALRMSGTICVYWVTNGMSGEGRHWIGRALAVTAGATRLRAEALWTIATLIMVRGADLDAARPAVGELREIAGHLGAPDVLAWADGLEGQLALFSSDAPAAIALLERAVGVLREHPARAILLQTYPLLASAHVMAGDLDRALAVCEEGHALGLRLGERWISSYCVFMRGLARWMRGDVAGAISDSRTCLRLQAGTHDQVGAAFLIDSLAWYAMAEGSAARAALLWGAAKTVWDAVSRPHLGVRGFLVLREQCEAAAREALGDADFDAIAAEGAGRPFETVIAEEISEPREPVARPPDRDPRWDPLTRREAEVARLVAGGLSNREIADGLAIARRTVETHVEHIMAKLGIHSRTLVALWVSERHSSD